MGSQQGRTAIVVGGSIGGLLAGLLLSRDGWAVDIFERVDVELTGRGAGIVTHPDLFKVLRAADVTIGQDFGVAVKSRRVFDRAGACIAELDYPQVLTSWDQLFHELRSRFPDEHYHKGRTLSVIDNRDDAVVAGFTDGSRARADLLVGADGFRSATRGQFFPGTAPSYAGYVAWRGLVEEGQMSGATKRDIFEHFAFSLPVGEQMLGYPVAGAHNDLREGRRRYNWVWYRPASEAVDLRDLLKDATGAAHHLSIPPPLIRPEVIAAMQHAATRTLAPQFQELVRLTERPFFQPIYDLEIPCMAVGRVAIIGDAAFVVRPHVGAGVTKAAQDALALAKSLHEGGGDVRASLRLFDQDRMRDGTLIIQRARHLGAYMQAQVNMPEQRLSEEQDRTAATVMSETASLEFLQDADRSHTTL
jgi:2-polyprenyl-6-methoxyphenol hydroxylase-like FAD-dependent oxidoreductase